MLVAITVPVGVLGLVDEGTLPAGASLEFERTASVFDCGSVSLVVAGDDVSTVVRSVRESPFIERVAVVADTDEESVVRLTWGETVPGMIESLRDAEATVLSARATDGTWAFELQFVSHDAASRFYTRYDDDRYPITVHRTSTRGTARRSGDRLTAEQRDALSHAMEGGYFEVPRQITLTELASDLGISDTAVSQRLRRGLSNVLGDSGYTSREAILPGRQDDR